MANNYIRPLLAVYQQLEITLAATGDHLHAGVIGPNYDLYRYGFENLEPHTYVASGMEIPFEYKRDEINDYEVDTKTVNVYAEDMEAEMAKIGGKLVVDGSDIMTLRASDAATNGYLYLAPEASEEATLMPELNGLGIEVGDVITCTTAELGTVRRYVTELVGEVIPAEASVSSVTTSVTENPATEADVTVDGGGADYNGDEDTTVLLTVTAYNAESKVITVNVSDTAGLFTSKVINITGGAGDFTNTGHGIKVKIADKKFAQGDVIAISAAASSASLTQFDGVRLSASPIDVTSWDKYKTTPVGAAAEDIVVSKEFSGDLEIVGGADDPWTIVTSKTTGEPVVKVAKDIALDIPGRSGLAPLIDGVGKLYVSFRVLIQADPNEDIFYIDTVEDIEDYFGTISPENELAYAAYWCFKGSQGRAIYALRTRGTDVESFHAAVEKTEAMTEVYSLAVISDDPEVIADIVEFNDKLSQPEVKRWRRTLCGIDSPGQYRIANRDMKNKQLTAKIVPYATKNASANVLLQISKDLDFDLTSIKVNGSAVSLKAGDKVKLETSGRFFTVKTVLSQKELILATGPETTVSLATPISIWKADTSTNNVDYIGALAKAFNSRRVTVVWCDGGSQDGHSEAVSNRFIAAEVAGISSAVVPQAGITRTEIQAIDRAPKMYTKYRQDQLDDIASKGVMIITQDSKGAPCYIRHQLTTEMDKGALYYEESPTRNLDNISYAMVDILEGYIGRSNVTPSALVAIKATVVEKLNDFTQDSPDPMIGPSLVSWDSLEVVQDPRFKDRIIIKVHLYLPLPLNGIRLYEMAYAADVTI